jgi:hypothetical protein
MAKKTPTAKKAADGGCQQLIAAIAAVKQLQDFVKEHGTVENALAAAVRVNGLMQMTGGFEQLKKALEIVGQESAPLPE